MSLQQHKRLTDKIVCELCQSDRLQVLSGCGETTSDGYASELFRCLECGHEWYVTHFIGLKKNKNIIYAEENSDEETGKESPQGQ